MTTRKPGTTSLWKLIESLQRRLEAEGLDSHVVDIAVTRGVEAWLGSSLPARKPSTFASGPPSRLQPLLGKA